MPVTILNLERLKADIKQDTGLSSVGAVQQYQSARRERKYLCNSKVFDEVNEMNTEVSVVCRVNKNIVNKAYWYNNTVTENFIKGDIGKCHTSNFEHEKKID